MEQVAPIRWSIEQGLKKRPPRQPTDDQLAVLAQAAEHADDRVAVLGEAYMRLSTERPLGYGCVGPIPHSRIEGWCDREGYDDDVALWFCDVIHEVDGETLRRQRAKK